MSSNQLNRNEVLLWLREAQRAIQSVMDGVVAGEFDDWGTDALGWQFDSILAPLCRAWHVRNLTDEQVRALGSDAIVELGAAVPNLGRRLRLVDPHHGEDLPA